MILCKWSRILMNKSMKKSSKGFKGWEQTSATSPWNLALTGWFGSGDAWSLQGATSANLAEGTDNACIEDVPTKVPMQGVNATKIRMKDERKYQVSRLVRIHLNTSCRSTDKVGCGIHLARKSPNIDLICQACNGSWFLLSSSARCLSSNSLRLSTIRKLLGKHVGRLSLGCQEGGISAEERAEMDRISAKCCSGQKFEDISSPCHY